MYDAIKTGIYKITRFSPANRKFIKRREQYIYTLSKLLNEMINIKVLKKEKAIQRICFPYRKREKVAEYLIKN